MDTNGSKKLGSPELESLVAQEHVERALRDLSLGSIDAVIAARPLYETIVRISNELTGRLLAAGATAELAESTGNFCASLAVVSALAMRHALWDSVLGEM